MEKTIVKYVDLDSDKVLSELNKIKTDIQERIELCNAGGSAKQKENNAWLRGQLYLVNVLIIALNEGQFDTE